MSTLITDRKVVHSDGEMMVVGDKVRMLDTGSPDKGEHSTVITAYDRKAGKLHRLVNPCICGHSQEQHAAQGERTPCAHVSGFCRCPQYRKES